MVGGTVLSNALRMRLSCSDCIMKIGLPHLSKQLWFYLKGGGRGAQRRAGRKSRSALPAQRTVGLAQVQTWSSLTASGHFVFSLVFNQEPTVLALDVLLGNLLSILVIPLVKAIKQPELAHKHADGRVSELNITKTWSRDYQQGIEKSPWKSKFYKMQMRSLR